MPVLEHIHTYIRWKVSRYSKHGGDKIIGGERQFKCNHPNCTHYMSESMVLGKASLCNGCGQEFVLDKSNIDMLFPKCLSCRKTKKADEHRKVSQIVDDSINSMLESVLKGPEEDY